MGVGQAPRADRSLRGAQGERGKQVESESGGWHREVEGHSLSVSSRIKEPRKKLVLWNLASGDCIARHCDQRLGILWRM